MTPSHPSPHATPKPTATKRGNPFYVLLILAGVAFGVTACAYAVMMVNRLQPTQRAAAGSTNSASRPVESNLLNIVDEYGDRALMIELVVLAVCTFASIGLDSYRDERRSARTTAEQSVSRAPVHRG